MNAVVIHERVAVDLGAGGRTDSASSFGSDKFCRAPIVALLLRHFVLSNGPKGFSICGALLFHPESTSAVPLLNHAGSRRTRVFGRSWRSGGLWFV